MLFYRNSRAQSQVKRSFMQRMALLHGFFFIILLIIVARLIELQVLHAADYASLSNRGYDRHINAKRGEIYSVNSKTDEASILATNTTLDLVYVDPLLVTDASLVAESLADILVNKTFYQQCSTGNDQCPRELLSYFEAVFDPMATVHAVASGALFEPFALAAPLPLPPTVDVPDITEVRRLLARDIEKRIADTTVTYVPLLQKATKKQMRDILDLAIPGVDVNRANRHVWADPEVVVRRGVDTDDLNALSTILGIDTQRLRYLLRQRDRRYVPIMRQLPPEVSLRIKELKLASAKDTQRKRASAPTIGAAEAISDPMRCIALIPEHWRFYPDGTVASQIIGFLNTHQEAQYGIERTYNTQLRGEEGIISMVSDLQGRQIVTSEQTIRDPTDGDRIYLTIDPVIQREVETILADALEDYQADSAQAIVMDPHTGRIYAMANAPLFERNSYSDVFQKEAVLLPEQKQDEIVVELYDPDTNVRILNAYIDDVFTEEGRSELSLETNEKLTELQELYDLEELARYFLYLGEHTRIELFPTKRPDVWLKFTNNIGVGAYLNRAIQAIYEPGSVMKAVTMAIALDQGEVEPDTMYNDEGPVIKDEENEIKNSLLIYYGDVTMTNCLEYSVNTCMTSVSDRLGKKLFHRILDKFRFGRITGIELDDEQQGFLLPWQDWSATDLATIAFGQGISTTPLHMTQAFAALANGGDLIRPTIIDRVEHADGTVERVQPVIVEQVIQPETSDTISAMLVSTVDNGYAKTAIVPGYRVAGKTGTSQIAGPGGKYESGTGSTITSFAGYAPAMNPRFVALVKFDRPKKEDYTDGASTAAPTFAKIAAFLLKYWGIAPEV